MSREEHNIVGYVGYVASFLKNEVRKAVFC